MAVRKRPPAPLNRKRNTPQPDAGHSPLAGREQAARTRPRTAQPATRGAKAPVDADTIRAALDAVGALVPPPEFDDLPADPAELEALIRKDEAWLLSTIKEPLGLSEAVVEDRG